MTARRGPDFSLETAVLDPGFFPRRTDVAAIVEFVAKGLSVADAAKRALVRYGRNAVVTIVDRARGADAKERARLVPLLGRLAVDGDHEELTKFLLEQLGDGDVAVRRAAAHALGKLRTPEVASALTNALAVETNVSARRAIVEAIGKTGGADAARSLDELDARGDELLARTVSKAALMARRTGARDVPSTFDASKTAPSPVEVVLHCRAGLAGVLFDELDASLSPRIPTDTSGEDQVRATLVGAPKLLFRARTMLGFSFPLPPVQLSPDDDIPSVLSRALASPPASTLFAAFTSGPVRFRIVWADGGKRRGDTWRVAEKVAELCPAIINDPTDSTWDIIVHERATPRALHVDLRPRVDDYRFAYRTCDVPAASHPTIAAALVRVAGVRQDDIVWDPFVGSGMELCERALSGPYERLIGTDRDPKALDAARRNLEAAGASNVELVRGDALSFVPCGERPTLIVTNPPMGRRVLRGEDLPTFLDRFLMHAASVVAPGGRIAWITPVPVQSARIAQELGLERTFAKRIDMGGFDGELQLLTVPPDKPRRERKDARRNSEVVSVAGGRNRPPRPRRESRVR